MVERREAEVELDMSHVVWNSALRLSESASASDD
jgi:hypothetical protein